MTVRMSLGPHHLVGIKDSHIGQAEVCCLDVTHYYEQVLGLHLKAP